MMLNDGESPITVLYRGVDRGSYLQDKTHIR